MEQLANNLGLTQSKLHIYSSHQDKIFSFKILVLLIISSASQELTNLSQRSLTWYQRVNTQTSDLSVLGEAEEETASLGVPHLHLVVLAAGHHTATVSSQVQTGHPATVT